MAFQAWFNSLGTGDKIATITALVGFLQFVVLYLTVRVMRVSARQQMRAYISAQPNFITSFDETHWPRGNVVLQNLGVTPAYHLSHRIEIGAFAHPLPQGFRLPAVGGPWSAPVVLFPDIPLTGIKDRGVLFSAAELDSIRSRTVKIYIYGEARYRDAFRKRRWLRFCASVGVESDETLVKLCSNSAERFSDIKYEIAAIGNDAN